MILTREQAQDSGVQFLQRRFSSSMVETVGHGVIWIDNIDGAGVCHYRPITSPYQRIEDIAVKRCIFFDLLPISNVQKELGFINTPQGAVELVDRGRRQWSWGASPNRFAIGAGGVRDNANINTAIMCMFLQDEIFPEQFLDNLPIAITRQFIWLPDGQIKDSFNYTIAVVNREDINDVRVISPTLYEELEPVLPTHHWNLYKGVLQ